MVNFWWLNVVHKKWSSFADYELLCSMYGQKIKGVPIQGWGCYLDHMWYLCCWKRFSSHQDQNKGCCFLVNDQNLDFWGMINALVVHVQNQWACVPHLPLFSTFRSGNPLINPLMNAEGREKSSSFGEILLLSYVSILQKSCRHRYKIIDIDVDVRYWIADIGYQILYMDTEIDIDRYQCRCRC